ncbi:MAG TPA: M28 family peptidase [Anaeromyxobacteraceae bacterium]|nr:M28 family peptidase [Anaeromyxobacteraceae bacterium]
MPRTDRVFRALACAAMAAATAPAPAAPPAAAPRLSPAEQAAADRVREDEISGHLRFLSHDLLEGRAPGERGDALAIEYLAAQLEAAGLKPGMPGKDGSAASWFQPVPLVKLVAQVPPAVEFRGPGGALALATGGGKAAELVVHPRAEVDRVKLDGAELVFVGYGITAPERGWDDYRGADVAGKVVVILNFNPPFAGEGVRVWYGRWDYKYQNAARHGAAAAIIVHTTPSAAYPWQVLTAANDATEFALPTEPGEKRVLSQMWIAEDAARRLFALGGKDLDERTRAARDGARKGHGAEPLGVKVDLDMPVTRTTTPSANVVGLLPGTDPALAKEYVVYTAHHDHLGISRPTPPATDAIHNGAVDNASGCATVLAIARAAAASPARRSMLFVFTAAEEKGLLGARWFARNPPAPAGRLAAVVNLDAVNVHGRTTDLGVLGLGKSSVDAIVRDVAAAQGRAVHGDPFPDRGSFYRSDHFELAQVGVPTVAVRGGPGYVGRPAGWGEERQKEYERLHYHQPSDEYPPSPERWDLSGAVQDAQLQLVVGLRVANAPDMPRWTPGDEFEKARLAAAR